MFDIPLDFSALSNLYCGRRYQLSCVRGIDSSSPDTDFGNACHAYFEARNKGSTSLMTDLVPPLISKWKVNEPTKFWLIANGFDTQNRPAPIVDTANNPLAEYKFSIPYATVNNKYRIILCGTMDLVYCESSKFLVIRDYKTTKALGSPAQKIVDSYTSSLQLPFYGFALYKYLHAFLCNEHADMALSLKITGEFQMIYASAPVPKFDRTPYCQINADTIAAVEQLIQLSIPKLIAIHEYPDIYPPEGSMYKLCPKCPYHNICQLPTAEQVMTAVKSYPVRQYDPTNFR